MILAFSKKKLIKLKSLFIILIIASSCSAYKNAHYFKKGALKQSNSSITKNITFQANDILGISISAVDKETIKPFVYSSENTKETNSAQQFTIDEKGEIEFPIIGKIKISGLTKFEAIELIKSKFNDHDVYPDVKIEHLNFKITILGDVKSPGTYSINDQSISIFEAIGLANDLNITGKKYNVLLIRDVNGQKLEYKLDLTKKDIVNSPVFYLKQNDVVYVEPTAYKVFSSIYGINIATIFSITSLLITTFFITTK